MKAHVTVLPGDGVGPEVTSEAVRILEAVGELWTHDFTLHHARIGGCAIDASGVPITPQTVAMCQDSAAVFLGAVGGPKWDDPGARIRPEQGLLRLRRELRLFANLRPVRVLPAMLDSSPLRPEGLEGVDLLFVRELTGGIYFGRKGREEERAWDECAYTRQEIERVVRVAASAAAGRRGRLTSVDKANVLETSRLWRDASARVVRDEFPGIELEHVLVDAFAMHILSRPRSFDVIVTENMFGDILTDEASVLAGSLGMLPSASLGMPADSPDGRVHASAGGSLSPRFGLYEPVHGSAPDLAGEDIANPIGAILSVSMLLRHSLGLLDEARAVELSVERVLADGARTRDLACGREAWIGTKEMGRAIEEALRSDRAAARPEAPSSTPTTI